MSKNKITDIFQDLEMPFFQKIVEAGEILKKIGNGKTQKTKTACYNWALSRLANDYRFHDRSAIRVEKRKP